MLLLLADWLSEYFTVFKVFQYLTFRGILGTLTALAITLPAAPAITSDWTAAKGRPVSRIAITA